MNGAMLAIVPVRAGVVPLGGSEAIAEAGGAALLIGSGCAEAGQRLNGVATALWTVDAGSYSPARWAATLAGVLPRLGPVAGGHLLLPASPDGRDLAPRVAAALDRDFVAGVIRIDQTGAEVTRFGGRVTDTLRLTAPIVATMQPGVRGVDEDPTLPPVHATPVDPAPAEPAAVGHADVAPGTAVVGPADDPALIEELPADPSTMDLAEADRIVGGGAGLGSPEAFDRLRELARRLGASPGGTRVVTDWGWLPVERQIGTTGVTVDPSLYLALGISGAVQHTAGLGSPDHIISVNTDPHCPMMALADLAIVCDGPEFLDRLLELLEPVPSGTKSDTAGSGSAGR